MNARRKLIAGNWKMNGLKADGVALARELAHRAVAAAQGAGAGLACDLVVCPPATLIAAVGEVLATSPIKLGGQDCHMKEKGAHTGDVSAAMLKDLGCSYVILGHSERRADHGETDAIVRAKVTAARAAGLIAIVCVGETEAERHADATLDVVARQISRSLPDKVEAAGIVIAYEPVWAIGSGRTPTARDVGEVHANIRRFLATKVDNADRVPILYGGSVKPQNAGALLHIDDVDGALVGGASLVAGDFWEIARAASPE